MTTIQMITLPDGSTRTVEVTVIETPPPSFGDADSGLVINEAYKDVCVDGPEEYEEAQRSIDELNRQLQLLAYIETIQVEACNAHEADLMALAEQIPMLEMSMAADEAQICKTAFDIAVAYDMTEAADEVEFCAQMADMCADAEAVAPITIKDLDEAEYCPQIDMSLYEAQLMQLETLSTTFGYNMCLAELKGLLVVPMDIEETTVINVEKDGDVRLVVLDSHPDAALMNPDGCLSIGQMSYADLEAALGPLPADGVALELSVTPPAGAMDGEDADGGVDMDGMMADPVDDTAAMDMEPVDDNVDAMMLPDNEGDEEVASDTYVFTVCIQGSDVCAEVPQVCEALAPGPGPEATMPVKIIGSGEGDMITTGDSDDVIIAMGGMNTIDSGAGDDEIVISSPEPSTITTGEGADTITLDKDSANFESQDMYITVTDFTDEDVISFETPFNTEVVSAEDFAAMYMMETEMEWMGGEIKVGYMRTMMGGYEGEICTADLSYCKSVNVLACE